MQIVFDANCKHDNSIKSIVEQFLKNTQTLETEHKASIIVFQDGASKSFYIKCSLKADDAAKLCDLDAKLDISNPQSYRANRELHLKNQTYQKMVIDSGNGREFNDIIVEYNTSYHPKKPLKVWGGQHRISAISEAGQQSNRYHGFRIYVALTKEQRTELALISNTNINVSNDTFDRMIEETKFGDKLRQFCRNVGLLGTNEDFPDVGSRADRITVKKARSFVVNFYKGADTGKGLKSDELDRRVYEPYLAETGGAGIDQTYAEIMNKHDILKDKHLIAAGTGFANLHKAQVAAIQNGKGKVRNSKAARNKAMVDSVLCGWAFVTGLLQSHSDRLQNHVAIPKMNSKTPDPLNSQEMSRFKHTSDPATYRGLGTRSSLKDRQRVAQLFLARSKEKNKPLERPLMDKAVSQVVGIMTLSKGYS